MTFPTDRPQPIGMFAYTRLRGKQRAALCPPLLISHQILLTKVEKSYFQR